MSNSQSRKGRHAAPSKGILSGNTGRRLAATAAALTAGAVPLACAGTAAAATGPQADLQTLGLPNVALPFGLPDSINPLVAGVPIANDLPLDGTLNAATPPLSDLMQVGDLGLLPQRPQADAQVRSATLDAQPADSAQKLAVGTGNLANAADRLLSGQTQRAATQLAEALPVNNVMPQLAASGGALGLAPNVLHQGALGTLTSGLSPQADALAGGVIGQAAPLVSQLRQGGVPTVSDLTGKLSGTQLPMVGSVGSLTQTLPVTGVLGADSPVTGALQSAGSL
ncbi:hypothetical protein [Actinocrinis sp.]|uniref:hypothetical protein n=1 Tax=Actinocrinis sp. TaxID=1920516 RepID=UPI002D2EA4F5|nr:hypothetical protein [Actinocrinis sp.]HZP55093.1 hypothetical protein [Actinocrinis sp.]